MNKLTKTIGTLTLGVAMAASIPSIAVAGTDEGKGMTSESSVYFSNGWREGKIEAAVLFNEHLNPFEIDVEVGKNTAYLVGSVSSDIEKDLAEQVALSVEGIDKVENRLEIKPDAKQKTTKSERQQQDGKFVQAVKDATIAAEVKMKLLASEHVSGFDIDVDTENKVVVLEGDVSSDAAKDLAGRIAENVDDVKRVENHLKVVKS
ncbi:BON domain-containing protein [Simiduia curdlanivorans]|uniref:BON domain-containing protein n=1 Tax=Simiduia curdlanivorans TaxID=1492769 RepID=A0ABV8V2M1_9GAMM|nr:BON domain-containing protein [Simiduia curdlanivorans]MDN3641057.1 BON domain-containing protein [Simiduia curdlanivorans]